jgi:structural maintenance of chromosome 4
LQGEVEQISLMKPKATTPHEVGFLEYLEDIIGTNKYVESINASAEQIVQLNEFFQEKMNRLKAVEKERGFLEKAKSEAVDYMKTVYQKNKLTCVMHQFQHREVEKKKEKLALEFSEISSSLDSIKIELKDVTDNLGNLSSSYDKIRSESDVLRKEAELSEKKWNDLDKELIKKKEELKFNKNSLKKFSSKIEKEKAQILEHAHLMENLVKGIPNLENAIQKVKVDLNHAEAERDKIFEMVRIKTEPLRLKLEEKQKELFPFSEKINERKQELVLIESQLKICKIFFIFMRLIGFSEREKRRS